MYSLCKQSAGFSALPEQVNTKTPYPQHWENASLPTVPKAA
jgi:hypothetical protein